MPNPLNLSLSITEYNDNLAIVLSDTTDNWGNNDKTNIDLVSLNHTTNTLKVIFRIVTPSDDVTYDAIELTDSDFGMPWATPADMVFTIDCSMLEYNGEALGTDETAFPDGVYYITYSLNDGADITNAPDYKQIVFIDGQVRNAVYDVLRQVPDVYKLKEPISYETYTTQYKDIHNAAFAYTYLKSLETSAYVAKIEELLTGLSVLQNFVDDVSDNIR